MKIQLCPDKTVGIIKPMHGVGMPPFYGMNFGMFPYLTEIGSPFVRLHDVGASHAHMVDIPHIFPNFWADPDDPSSYDFAFTDKLIAALEQNRLNTFFRLGVSIENHRTVKAYHIDPPEDALQWARICEGVIRHYREGWADGFHYDIRYWEIWNEPEHLADPKLNQMWTGTKEQFFQLYETASKHLKKCFPDIFVGGYASCGFYALYADPKDEMFVHYDNYMVFFNAFLAYVKEHDCPLDFFSWHNYNGVKQILQCASYARKRLDEEGFKHTKTFCNEWNCDAPTRGTAHHAARNTAILLGMQDSPLDGSMFYDARIGVSYYGGLFNPMTREPLSLYYGFMAYNELFKRKNQIKTETDGCDTYAVAACDGTDTFLLIASEADSDRPLELYTGGKTVTACKIITEGHIWEDTVLPDVLKKDTVLALWLE